MIKIALERQAERPDDERDEAARAKFPRRPHDAMVIKRVVQAGALFVVLALLCLACCASARGNLAHAFAPIHAFEPARRRSYADPALWIARPGTANDPAHGCPGHAARPGERRCSSSIPPVPQPRPLERAARRHRFARRADLLVAATASAFNAVGPVWVPRYRQAALAPS
jgi:hypothetical protein